MVVKDLVWCSKAKSLARPVIQAVGDELDVDFGDHTKVRFLWEVLSDKTVGVLDGASLPRSIGVGKEKVSV